MSRPGSQKTLDEAQGAERKVKEIKVVALGDVEIKSSRRVRYTSAYTIGKYYVAVLLPVVLERTVEAFGRERQEYYLVGHIEEFENVTDATEAFRANIESDPLAEAMASEDPREPMAIAMPRSLLKQLIKRTREKDPEALKGKGVIVALIHVSDSGRTIKRGGKEYPVRQYSILELETITPKSIELEDGERVSVLSLSLVQNAVSELKSILGINGGEEDGEAQE